MIYIKKLLNTELKYDSETERLFRFHKRFKRWKIIDPDINYNESTNRIQYNRIRIDSKKFLIYRVIYFVCNDDFNMGRSFRYNKDNKRYIFIQSQLFGYLDGSGDDNDWISVGSCVDF